MRVRLLALLAYFDLTKSGSGNKSGLVARKRKHVIFRLLIQLFLYNLFQMLYVFYIGCQCCIIVVLGVSV